ncbi:MAG: molybdopterin-dependent oxidoreductase [Candidatus Thiodiazotropha sp. (ex Epidulcina cf. delphinae)]|nr:molybdopterin-dependent oxidoreductase [Candidatus Thiodiazotropha sp. (ex Epidulcina cf. delphinae)]
MKKFNPDRRKFLKLGLGLAGGSLILGINWSCSADPDSGSRGNSKDFSPNAWLRLDKMQGVTVIVAESEMGQGPFTLLPMMLADELEVGWKQVKVERAPATPVYGYQLTGGSGSIRKGWSTLREAGAVTKELLLTAGSIHLGVPKADCTATGGWIIHQPTGERVSYGELIDIAATLPIPHIAHLKEPDEFKIIGTPVPRLDTSDKISGRAKYGIDIRLPDMLYATITHCPVFGGKLKGFDATASKAIKGIVDVFSINEGVVVVAKDTWTAFKARQVLKIEWDFSDQELLSDESIIEHIKSVDSGKGKVIQNSGEDIGALSQTRTLESSYILPFQAHVAMEPMNCTARYKGNKLEVWAPTQSPTQAYNTAKDNTRNIAARTLDKIKSKVFGSHDENVEINTTFLGGGFGRRLQQDYVAEVVQIAKKTGKPVQLTWTRDEDVQHDFYHPFSIHELSGKIDARGMPIGWRQIVKGLGISTGNSGRIPYEIPNKLIKAVNIEGPIPTGPWRSVGHHYYTFATEHFLDELARAGSQDPLELRLKLLGSSPRLRNVIEVVADKGNWKDYLTGHRLLGVAARSSFGSHVAQIAEIELIDREYKIRKITCVLDCGLVINPDIAKAQMEGSIVFGLTAALKSKITLKQGRVEQSNFHDYPILTMRDTPEIEVFLVNSQEQPEGIGEPGVPTVAPAVANALLNATGSPVRSLPMAMSISSGQT